MKNLNVLCFGIAISMSLAATPGFAQIKGVGAGVGSQVQTRGDVDVKTPAANTGVDADATTQAGAKAQTGGADSVKASGQSNTNIAVHIQSNPKLNTHVQSMLPSGASVTDAAAGFKDQGQFLATLHASQNLNIPFDQLKTHVTGSGSVTLGAAIKQSRPDMDDHKANDEAKKAQKQAKDDGK